MRVLALTALVLGATVVPQTLEQMVDRSDAVVRAVVLAQHAQRAEGAAGIYTYSRLEVVESLKGKLQGEVRVRQAGGTVGRTTVALPGDATLSTGEQVLVFLTCRPGRAYCTVVGLAQGKYHLEPNGKGVPLATRDFHETAFVHGPAPEAGPIPYDALARRIRARAAAAGKR